MFVTDKYLQIAFRTDVFRPLLLRIPGANVSLVHGPRSHQRMVDDGDLVMDHVGIGAVEVDPLLEYGLIVKMQRQPCGVERARPPESARFHLEHVVASVAVLVDPAADRIALISGLDFRP
jgi:hypothetical protein